MFLSMTFNWLRGLFCKVFCFFLNHTFCFSLSQASSRLLVASPSKWNFFIRVKVYEILILAGLSFISEKKINQGYSRESRVLFFSPWNWLKLIGNLNWSCFQPPTLWHTWTKFAFLSVRLDFSEKFLLSYRVTGSQILFRRLKDYYTGPTQLRIPTYFNLSIRRTI